eukprot:768234-Hanusia_phi.AAC.2
MVNAGPYSVSRSTELEAFKLEVGQCRQLSDSRMVAQESERPAIPQEHFPPQPDGPSSDI